MEFEQLIDTAEEWCSGNPFELIAAECSDERRLDFYAEPRFSFYVLCPDANCDTDSFSSKALEACLRTRPKGVELPTVSPAKPHSHADVCDRSETFPLFRKCHKRIWIKVPVRVIDTRCLHVWSENEDCLPFLQRAQDYISACGRKSLVQVLDEVFSSFRPLLDLPDTDDTETFEQYHTNVEEEPETDHQQLAVSQQ